MCGRFAINHSLKEAAEIFECNDLEGAPSRYNIAPTQPIPVIFQEFNKREMRLMRWGFLPSWVKEPKDFSLIINARSESVLEKPSFKSAIRHRRCIIPASGFYEWHRAGEQKTPYYIAPKNGAMLGYAGLYETYAHANGSEIDTVCFLTTEASSDIAAIHHRMQVLVPPKLADVWLDCGEHSPSDVSFLYGNERNDFYNIIPVSDRVNAVRNDDADLQSRIEVKTEPDQQEADKSSSQLSLF